MNNKNYKVAPGRGLVTRTAIDLRKAYLKDLGFDIQHIEKTLLDHTDVQNNIESLVGSVEIPTGLVGPLRFSNNDTYEDVFCLAGTLEGALVASMNRGARAISMCGGFNGKVIHQKMLRAPVFKFASESDARLFYEYIETSFLQIKEEAEGYSNHAVLISVEPILDKEFVHTRFTYTTGDAAGQNMTTTCTWHAIQWIKKEFEKEFNCKIISFLLEGNGASDKKVSHFLIKSGRGIKVEVHCTLTDDVIQKVLRTNSEKLYQFYLTSRKLSERDGMVGYNFNVANVIAAIFVATGQDLASIHESSVADLEFKKVTDGLAVKLTLFSLVIGSLGGGTHLQKQNQALQLMKCDGIGKVERLALLIAGFSIGLELSTSSALASGEFAKAHEKLGRNKPTDWLQWKEINQKFVTNVIAPFVNESIDSIKVKKGEVDNGILMNLSKRVNRKLIGFIPVEIKTANGNIVPVLIKSKATDLEVIKGLHLMAASINPVLSDLISTHKEHLEYKDCHIKELTIPEALHENNLNCCPIYFGSYTHEKREIYLLFQERIKRENVALMDSENSPHLWSTTIIKNTIATINEVHKNYIKDPLKFKSVPLQSFEISNSIPLYQKLIDILKAENSTLNYELLENYLREFEQNPTLEGINKTMIHNDFNSRNIIIRNDKSVCIYDWELAVLNYPQRDVVELLSFTLSIDFTEEEFLDYIVYHYEIAKDYHNKCDWATWKKGCIFTLKEYLLNRVAFYKAAEILMKLKFVDRIFQNSIRMIKILDK